MYRRPRMPLTACWRSCDPATFSSRWGPPSRHTTVRIGGPADLYIKVESVEALVRVLEAARRHATPWFILGAGSNLLVGDGGIRGVVIEHDAKAIDGPALQPDGRARF